MAAAAGELGEDLPRLQGTTGDGAGEETAWIGLDPRAGASTPTLGVSQMLSRFSYSSGVPKSRGRKQGGGASSRAGEPLFSPQGWSHPHLPGCEFMHTHEYHSLYFLCLASCLKKKKKLIIINLKNKLASHPEIVSTTLLYK